MAMRKRELFAEYDFLGGRISSKHPLFKILARLGYEEAEQYALVEFLEWFTVNPEATLIEILKKAIELRGMSKFLALTTEITKLSMILGHKTKVRDYDK